jgi:nicotinate-nucleotide adenylyltransferase
VGILGGTFNPPHLGHLAIADAARAELGLERVLLMPVHTPPHKSEEPDPGAAHRLQMCRLAVHGRAGLEACALEVERGGPSYTADTLRAIHAGHPEAELTFIVGADTAGTLPAWHEPGVVLELAELAVAARSGTDRGDVLDAIAGVLGTPRPGERVRFLDTPELDISASGVRARVAAGEGVRELVGDEVADYIAAHHLYDAGGVAP